MPERITEDATGHAAVVFTDDTETVAARPALVETMKQRLAARADLEARLRAYGVSAGGDFSKATRIAEDLIEAGWRLVR